VTATAPIAKLLVANRGEIARRVLRTCRDLGIATVAVFSDADRDAPFVAEADEAVALGGSTPAESYLRAEAIVAAAERTGAGAVHPGYGFLAESAAFAATCAAAGLLFIGPTPEAITALGDKRAARELAARAGVPVLPGYGGDDQSDAAFEQAAARIGWPIMVKAAAGGGGKGMRMVSTPRELESVLRVCRSEAKAAFGDDSLYLEKWLDENRHVEVQVAVDRYGHGVHLGERDCSVQRRHQKILEEAPTPALNDAARADLAERALKAIVAAGYENVATLEFLVDRDGSFYFIEINCRIQVEHPVTEMLTGVDLVATQMRIAAGEPLGLTQADITFRGHAIEFRINAEDPDHEFRPSAGSVERYLAPGGPGVRMDSHLFTGYEVPPYYDSLLGKLIVWGPDRPSAIARGRVALEELVVDGVVTNIAIHQALLASEAFLEGKMTTNLLDRVGSAAFLAAAARV